MNLKDYLSQKPRGTSAALAKAIGAHAPDFSNWVSGERPIPVHFCVRIEKETLGEVPVEELLEARWIRIPDRHWPHIAGRPLVDVSRETLSEAREGA